MARLRAASLTRGRSACALDVSTDRATRRRQSTFEGTTRRNVPFRVRKALLGAGALAMLLLVVTTFFNDLGRLGLLPQ